MRLHSHAAVRVLRNEHERLMDCRAELSEALEDCRIPAGVIADQLAQCERELGELIAALRLLSAHGCGAEQIPLDLIAARAA